MMKTVDIVIGQSASSPLHSKSIDDARNPARRFAALKYLAIEKYLSVLPPILPLPVKEAKPVNRLFRGSLLRNLKLRQRIGSPLESLDLGQQSKTDWIEQAILSEIEPYVGELNVSTDRSTRTPGVAEKPYGFLIGNQRLESS